MPRILGVDIPVNKRVTYALQTIYGIGPAIAAEIVERAKIDPQIKASELTDENIAAITVLLQNDYTVEGDLRRELVTNIRRLQVINSYRGMRHKKGLPCRGQRTRTNARTRKGKKITVGAIRDKTQRRVAASAADAKAAGAAPAQGAKKK
ncbi:MAG: 30S ribosomal protein S13 [Lentisphaeria bacterium]|nr:30S ribosomal protein S13 [Lentisphaerota bacterium]MBO5694012.1 30S ribosomal protein S13 [Lentisphaeria bacterium]MBO5802432.1 30S ribosomal protein S13 [Lentisphaeria bacterium]MBR4884777.1 30S ribosomal protein S13 [Lentisphaeria bacterium]